MVLDGTEMRSPTRLAIAGIGLVGRRHAEAVEIIRHVELSAVVDPSAAGRDYAAKHGLSHFESIDRMLLENRPDGLILATPTPLHLEQGLACIAQGLPILVEKPLAVTADEASRLMQATEGSDVPVLVGHHRRHNSIVQTARQVIEDGHIGEIRAVHAQCWFYKPDHYFDQAPWRKRYGAGPISINLVHDVDLMRYFCGEIVKVQAQAAPSTRGYENEEVAAAVLTLANGAVGTITVADTVAAPWSWEMTSGEYPIYPQTAESAFRIGGTRGSLSIPDLTLWTHQGEPDWWTPISATRMPRPSSDPLANQILHFVDMINDKEPPLVSAREGYMNLQVIEAIRNAAATGKAQKILPVEAVNGAPAAVNAI